MGLCPLGKVTAIDRIRLPERTAHARSDAGPLSAPQPVRPVALRGYGDGLPLHGGELLGRLGDEAATQALLVPESACVMARVGAFVLFTMAPALGEGDPVRRAEPIPRWAELVPARPLIGAGRS